MIAELPSHACCVLGGFGGLGISCKMDARMASKIHENKSLGRLWVGFVLLMVSGLGKFQMISGTGRRLFKILIIRRVGAQGGRDRRSEERVFGMCSRPRAAFI